MPALLAGAREGPVSPAHLGMSQLDTKLGSERLLYAGAWAGCRVYNDSGRTTTSSNSQSQGKADTQGDRTRTVTGCCARVSSIDCLSPGSPSIWVEVRSGGERRRLSWCEAGESRLVGGSGNCTEPKGKRSEGAGVHPIAQKYLLNVNFAVDAVSPGYSLEKTGRCGATGSELGWNFKLGSFEHIEGDECSGPDERVSGVVHFNSFSSQSKNSFHSTIDRWPPISYLYAPVTRSSLPAKAALPAFASSC